MTDAARSLADRLRALRFAKRWPWQRDPRVPVLRALADTGDPGALGSVLSLLGDSSEAGREANRTAAALLSVVPMADLAALERRLRHHLRYDYPPQATRRDLIHGLSTPGAFAYLALASFHPDGYVREAAVRRLDRHDSGREIPYLLLRLSDWVEPVRRLAAESLSRRLTPHHTRAWVDALPVLVGISSRQRPDVRLIRAQVLKLLSLSGQPDVLDDALAAPDVRVRRAAHRFAREAGGPLALRAARHASGDVDVRIRLDTARALHRGDLDAPDLAREMATDPAMGVRREALLALLVHAWPGADDALEVGLLDLHASVRETARYFATQRASGDRAYAPLYRSALEQADRATEVRAALGGLAETGTPGDAALARPFLTDPRATVRAAAVRAVGALAPAASPEALPAALYDSSGRVVRAAAQILASGGSARADVAAALADAFGESDSEPSRRALLLEIARLPPWAALPHLLRATAKPDTRGLAIERLGRWVDPRCQVFTRPSPAERAAIDSAWTGAQRAGLPAALAREIRAHLDRDG